MPGSLSSPLQTTYFTSPAAPRTVAHLRKRGKGGAAHAAEVSLLQDFQDGVAQPDSLLAEIGVVIGLPGLGPTANDLVARPAAVGIDLPLRRGLGWFLAREASAAPGRSASRLSSSLCDLFQ